ncbi:ABC transporter substrate-binding protein [Nocardioides sp. dk4132]|uniref:ABC transporter substrate-binding protein n=1 Tax=unclassified Nocardioides TaxID=2615069 RepID=UPI0012951E1C|nr:MULTISPECIES: ABC transporter substrate-binding protein [unclassified Nocardioides]MQW77608.1 ABC transporter substrate-binding protein [Nocardioides sp. dk4132]QGA06134.1 ABC transporter substrate-binding protein [Nocardioides sp. dk884]
MRTRTAAACVTASLALALTACGSDDGTAEGNDSGPLKVGVIASLTGPSSETFKVTPDAADARIKQYVADGGECADRFDGYELVKADDTNTPEGALRMAQRLVQQDKVDVILQGTAAFYGASQFLTTDPAAKKIPVLGGGFDGAPVYMSTDNNVFANFAPIDFEVTYTTYGELMKKVGGTKAAVIAYDNPSSAPSAEATIRSIKASGLEVAYENLKIPYGSTDVGAVTQGMIDAGVDTLITSLNPETAFGVIGGLKQAGHEMKLVQLPIGYSAQLLESEPSVQAGQDVSFSTSSAPMELHNEATEKRSAALKTIGNDSGIAGFAEDQGYLAADMLIFGLEEAGCDSNGEEIMAALRETNTWDGSGLLPLPRDFGSAEAGDQQCSYYVKLTGKEFVPVSEEPICGDKI